MFDVMTTKISRLLLSLALLGLMTAQAHAGCLDSLGKSLRGGAGSSGHFSPMLYHPDDPFGARLVRINDFDEDDSIVGVWKFQLTGFLKDFGTQAYHAGGTETMFSAGVDPSTGDVCQGVWRRVGRSTYTLNHIAMAWTAPGAQYGVLIHFHMLIKVAPRGNTFTGTYKVSLFSATPENPFDESVGAFATGSGTLSATRLQAD